MTPSAPRREPVEYHIIEPPLWDQECAPAGTWQQCLDALAEVHWKLDRVLALLERQGSQGRGA